MPAGQRKPDPAVIQDLFDHPGRYSFFQAVRIALAWLRQQGVTPEAALREHLRFDNSTSLSFPAGEIESLWREPAADKDEDGGPPGMPDYADRLHITPAFMGFLGPHGVLPAHYTDAIAAYERLHHDPGPRAWLDSLSNRAVALFYLAWARHRPECRAESDTDGGRRAQDGGLLAQQLALAGSWPGRRAESAAAGPRPETVAYYAALLRHRPVSAEALQNVLADYLGVPVTLTRFVADSYPAPPTVLGVSNCILGGGAMLGVSRRRADLLTEVRLGPLTRQQYEQFLPTSDGARALEHMLGLFSVPLLRYRVRLVLRAVDIRPARLASGAWPADGFRLGVDGFLGDTPAAARDRDDLIYEIRFPGSVAPLRMNRL